MSKVNRYELANPGKLKEEILIEYTDGRLSAIVLPVKHPLNVNSFHKLIYGLQYFEQDIQKYSEINLTAVPDPPKNKKLAMFCEKYMEYNQNEKYKGSGNDANVIGAYKVTYEILDVYFKSTNFFIQGKHGVFNFTKYYNLVMKEMTNPNSLKYPNYYDKGFADKMKPEDLPKYWEHLRMLGLEPKKNTIGALTDWIKKV